MNVWQALRQIRYLILARNWSGGSNRVFGTGSVLIASGIPDSVKKHIRLPAALIYPVDAQVDPMHQQEPDIISQSITIVLITAVPGDHAGTNTLIGANIPDRTKSEGRGLLEVEEEMLNAIDFLNTDSGVVIQHVATGAAKPIPDDDMGYIAFRDYTFKADVTADRFYQPCFKFVATGGVGSVTMTWGLPPDRYDRYRVVLRRATGATAPATVTDGTGVTLASNLATSVTDTIAAGTYSYAIFAQFDETNETAAQADRTSASVTRTSVVVT